MVKLSETMDREEDQELSPPPPPFQVIVPRDKNKAAF